jgi:tRNA threonylcarbamoyl adenosine modification protein (Sua5/YciO/YrdC/YwlC family)
MVASADMLPQVVESVPEAARRMIDAVWPGDVTLRLPLCRSLDRRVYKDLSRPDGKVGVRLPLDPVAELLVRAAGVPVLVSSANRSKKAGSGSIALIRKQFAPCLSMLIDAGDLPSRPPSTIVDFDDPDGFRIVRRGAVSEEEIRRAIAGRPVDH